jgi:hypothetical protein
MTPQQWRPGAVSARGFPPWQQAEGYDAGGGDAGDGMAGEHDDGAGRGRVRAARRVRSARADLGDCLGDRHRGDFASHDLNLPVAGSPTAGLTTLVACGPSVVMALEAEGSHRRSTLVAGLPR